MLPASGSADVCEACGRDSRVSANVCTGCCGAGDGAYAGVGAGAGVATIEAEVTGRLLFTALVSKATRLISSKCSGETLSDVTLPPQEPQPRVIDGGSAVENPIAPCAVGVLTVMRDAGISLPKRTAASRERV